MVGVPRSRGCARCVKRRVKCDERLPGCAKCEVYGQACPGYDRGFKFVTGRPYRTRRGQPKPDHAGPNNNRADYASPTSSQDSRSAELAMVQREMPPSVVSADLNMAQSLGSLIDDFSYPVPDSQRHVVAQWFGFLPSVYGQNPMLDATIRSFVAHHFGKVTQSEQMVVYARSAYGEALRRLRKSLAIPSECLSSYVFCAVVLLCLYELFTETESPDSWMKHAKGLGQLVKIRGPGRYNNKLDMTLLRAARGLIVMHSMFSGEECFLASEDWHQTMQQHNTTDMPPELHHCIESFFAYFTYAPSLVHKLYHLKEIDISTPAALQIISQALEQALEMQDKLDLWYQRWSEIEPPPSEVPSTTNDPLFPMVLTYRDTIDATIYCSYFSYMVIIHEVLKTFDYPGPHAELVVYFRDQICKSIEYNSIGILGPYRMGFSLRVAIEVADPTVKSWIIARLEQFSKFYAAAKPENFDGTSSREIYAANER